MLMSIVRSIVVRCWQRTIVATMLLEQELTIVDEKSLLMVVHNDSTMMVECEQLWIIVVDNSCWLGAAQHCWQGAAQHCNKLLTTLVMLFIFACVKCSSRNTEIMSILCVLKVDNPVSILNQDTSRNFLFASDEKKKYKVFPPSCYYCY